MSDTTSNQFRKALASAIKYHVDTNKLNGVTASKIVGCANSRMSQIIRGEVDKISSDALIDVLAKFGYRLSTVIGSTDGHEFTLMPYEKGEWEKFDNDFGLPKDIEPPKVYGATHDMSDTVYEVGTVSEEALASLAEKDSDPDADRVIADA